MAYIYMHTAMHHPSGVIAEVPAKLPLWGFHYTRIHTGRMFLILQVIRLLDSYYGANKLTFSIISKCVPRFLPLARQDDNYVNGQAAQRTELTVTTYVRTS